MKKFNKTLRIGTRGSKLAIWQSEWVSAQLKTLWPDLQIELKIIKTTGDKMLDVQLSKIGGKGLFLKEIETELLNNRVDLAVHSMKDVPTELPKGLYIASILEREDPRDALVSNRWISFADLAAQARVGTSSLRRLTQLKKLAPDLNYQNLRGNVDTRLRKLDENQYDAIILAAAGLKRLGYENRITEYLDLIPAVGQGAVGIEIREADEIVQKLIAPLNHKITHQCVKAERAFLTVMEGSCQVPIGCYAEPVDKKIHLKGFIADLEGNELISSERTVELNVVDDAAKKLGYEILKKGGEKILGQIKAALGATPK